jgi:hypothetical protein
MNYLESVGRRKKNEPKWEAARCCERKEIWRSKK